MSTSFHSFCLSVLFLLPALRADVIVVDAAGGGDFTRVQDALDAAVDGDTVLVRPGDYTGHFSYWSISSKSLVLVGDVGGTVLLGNGNISAPAGFTVVVRNITIPTETFGSSAPMRALTVAGHGRILLEGCVLTGGIGDAVEGGWAGLFASNARSVVISRCTITGGRGNDTLSVPGTVHPTSGGIGVWLTSMPQVAIFSSTIRGGDGGTDTAPGVPDGSGSGNTGLFMTNSRAYASGSTIEGGDGGSPCKYSQSGCGGGEGMISSPQGFSFQDVGMTDTVIVGGEGGEYFAGGFAPDGEPLIDTPNQHYPGVRYHAGETYGFVVDGPLRENAPGNMTVSGPAGSLIGVYVGLDLGFVSLNNKGVFAIDQLIAAPLFATTLPPSGELVIPFTTPSLVGTGLEGFSFFAQTFNQDADGIRASDATAVIILDDAL